MQELISHFGTGGYEYVPTLYTRSKLTKVLKDLKERDVVWLLRQTLHEAVDPWDVLWEKTQKWTHSSV